MAPPELESLRYKFWVWNPKSDAHVCHDRECFKAYTPFESEVSCMFWEGYQTFAVAGVGTVEMPIKNLHQNSNNDSRTILRITDVLHVPELPYNVIASTPVSASWALSDKTTCGYIYDREKSAQSLPHCFRILGTSVHFEGGGPYYLEKTLKPLSSLQLQNQAIKWSASERQRWQCHTLETQDPGAQPNMGPGDGDRSVQEEPPYSSAEKMWLRATYGTECLFLRMYGLDPFRPEHRQEGREVARAIILAKEKGDGLVEEYEREDQPWPDHPESDRIFSPDEFDYIVKRWGSICKFMQALCLDTGNQDHWESATWLVRARMRVEG
ncbi:hypothetical protein F4777DRAFT_593523 [Nemania sp. FL0916]|nr:hypothetical protein F4777DRAFT_593523 [Nemania sp. FL0916]